MATKKAPRAKTYRVIGVPGTFTIGQFIRANRADPIDAHDERGIRGLSIGARWRVNLGAGGVISVKRVS